MLMQRWVTLTVIVHDSEHAAATRLNLRQLAWVVRLVVPADSLHHGKFVICTFVADYASAMAFRVSGQWSVVNSQSQIFCTVYTITISCKSSRAKTTDRESPMLATSNFWFRMTASTIVLPLSFTMCANSTSCNISSSMSIRRVRRQSFKLSSLSAVQYRDVNNRDSIRDLKN